MPILCINFDTLLELQYILFLSNFLKENKNIFSLKIN
jgi:hypothetical protein